MTFEELMADLRRRGWTDQDFAALAGKSGQEFTDTVNFINNLKAQSGGVDQLIRQRYPQMAWALEHPELGPLLRRGIAEGWDAPRLQGELLKTTWFQTTSEAERTWDRMWAEDPATARTTFYQTVSRVDLAAKRLGITLDQQQLFEIASSVGRSQWDEAQLNQKLLEMASFQGEGQLQGQLNATVDRIKQTANDYFAPIADSDAFEFARKVLLGQMDQGTMEAYFKDLAVARFQGNEQITRMLDQGFTPTQIFAPYVQQTAQLLEVGPSQVDLMDPKFSQILDYNDNGTTRPMTLTEAGQFIRGTEEYKGTQGAVSQAADFAEFIGQRMGAVA